MALGQRRYSAWREEKGLDTRNSGKILLSLEKKSLERGKREDSVGCQ
jgi:hypothetical protein